jgi:hypothetical protein
MARSYYSTIFEQSADDVWNVIRDFNNDPVWVDGAAESRIEARLKPPHTRCRNITLPSPSHAA